MADQSGFQQYYKLADMLIEQASKEQLAECARLLALNLAHYQGKFGEMPLEDTLAILDATEPNDDRSSAFRHDYKREALALAGGDLLNACEQHESLRAEICLAWLREQIERQPECAPLELVRAAVGVFHS